MTNTAPSPDHDRCRVAPSPGRRLRLLVTAATLAGAAVLAACGDDGGDTEAGGASGGSEGEAVYQDKCAVCHGADLRGTSEGPSHLSRVYEPGHHPDEAFESAIRNGSPEHHWDFGDMPPVPGLSDEEVDAVIAYIRDVQEAEGFED